MRAEKRDPGATGSWFVSISLVLVVATASMLAGPLFTTVSWTPDAVIMSAAVIGAAALVRTFTGGVLLPFSGSVAATIVVLSVKLAPDSMAGFFGAWGEATGALVEQLMSDALPLRETPAAVLAMLALIALIAIVCDIFVFGLRGRVSAVLPVLVFPILPIAAGVSMPELWPALLLAGAFALYLFATAWWHQRIADDNLANAGYIVDDRGMSGWFGALTAAAAGIVVALVASVALPVPMGVSWLTPNPASTLSTNRANPIVDLGDDLRREEPVPVLHYATSIAEGPLPYLSLVTLTELDSGSEWGPGEFTADASTAGGAQLPAPAGLAPVAPVTSFGANIILEQGVSSYLPRPGMAQSVSDLTTEYGWQASTGDLRELNSEALAQHYEYSGLLVNVSPELIAVANLSVPPDLQPLTEVPGGAATDRIRAQLDAVVDPSASVYAQALQVQAFLTSDAFTYSETAPVNGGYDGSNLDVTAAFLDVRSGYCVHFSSAMAVMARMLGIPSRVQVGFTPGTPTSMNDQGQVIYHVTSNDLHAWAELWIDGLGWVPFEATPASGLGNTAVPDPEAPTEAPEAPEETEQAEQPQETGATQPTPTPTDATDDSSMTSPTEGEQSWWPRWLTGPLLIVLGVLLAALVVLSLPALARLAQRRRRRSIIATDGAGAAALAWRELLDEAADHGAAVPGGAEVRLQERRLLEAASPTATDGPDATPASRAEARARGRAATVDLEAVREALERVRIAVERSAFDRPEAAKPPVDWADVDLVERALRANATPRRRLRAVLAPASLPGLRQSLIATTRRLRDTVGQRGAVGQRGDDDRGSVDR